jgi:hypothetical protein
MADVMQVMKKQKVAEDVPMLDILENDVEQSGGSFDEVYAKLKPERFRKDADYAVWQHPADSPSCNQVWQRCMSPLWTSLTSWLALCRTCTKP